MNVIPSEQEQFSKIPVLSKKKESKANSESPPIQDFISRKRKLTEDLSGRQKYRRASQIEKTARTNEQTFSELIMDYALCVPKRMINIIYEIGSGSFIYSLYRKYGRKTKHELSEEEVDEVVQLKDESFLSDEGYKTWIGGRMWRKFFPSLSAVKLRRTLWNKVTLIYIRMTSTKTDKYSGKQIPVEVAMDIIQRRCLLKKKRRPKVLKFKLTLDGRLVGGRSEVLVGVIPMNLGFKVHSPHSVFPVQLTAGDEGIFFSFLYFFRHRTSGTDLQGFE